MEGQIGAGGGGGGFVFTPAELESVIARWERLHADLMEDNRQVHALMSVQGPGDEFASHGAAERANDSGSAFMRHHSSMVEAVGDYTRRLKAARRSYVADDEAVGDLLRGVAR